MSVHPSSIALLDKAGFCALQDNIFPLSSAFGRNVRELDVRLSEKVSFPDWILLLSIHHVSCALGRAPELSQDNWIFRPAENGLWILVILTSRGFTVNTKKDRYDLLFRYCQQRKMWGRLFEFLEWLPISAFRVVVKEKFCVVWEKVIALSIIYLFFHYEFNKIA